MTGTLRCLLRDRRGIAALETGIVLSALLLPMLAGIAGVGQATLLQYRVDRATHMGLLYAWGTPSTATASNVVAAAQAGYGSSNTDTSTTTASIACYCLDQAGTRTSSNTTSVSCTGSCTTSGQVLGKWVTVATSISFTPVLAGSWSGGAWTLQNSSTVRIQ